MNYHEIIVVFDRLVKIIRKTLSFSLFR